MNLTFRAYTYFLIYNRYSIQLGQIVNQLVKKDSVVIQGEAYKLDNVVYTTDVEILKTRLLLKGTSNENKIAIDVDITAKIYKC